MKTKANRNTALNDPQATDFPPRIKKGLYDAVCFKTEIGPAWGGRRNLYFRFRIIEGEFMDVELFMTCPYPKGKLSSNFKYYKQWMLAAGRPPHKREFLKRKVFKNRAFRIIVRDTRRKFDTGKEYPDFMQYSVVDSIVEPLTGGYEP